MFKTDRDTTQRDFYWKYDRGIEKYDSTSHPVQFSFPYETLDAARQKRYADKHFYELTFSNKGGLVMPIITVRNFKAGGSLT